MEHEVQTNHQLWYIRRAGQIEGPFPVGHVSRHILLGRISECDELSCDLINWRPLSAWPDLIPAAMKADASDPLAQERLQAARRWADERSVLVRRQEQEPVAMERRHMTPERRHKEAEEELQHRAARQASPPPVAGTGGYSRVYAGLIALLLLLAVAALIVMVPVRHAELGSDCAQPPAPGVNWSNCFKEGLILEGGDLSGAVLKNMKLSGANLSGSRLQGADFSYTELSVALLRAADLQNATMIGISLRGADLRDSDLRQANLAYADLRGADLRGADLSGAILDSAIWTDGRYCGPGSMGQCRFSVPPPRDRL